MELKKLLFVFFGGMILLSACAIPLSGEDPFQKAIREPYKGLKTPKDIKLKGIEVSQMRVTALLKVLKEVQKDRAPVDATWNPQTWEITPEMHGQRLDVEATLEKLFKAQPRQEIEPIYFSILPRVTKMDLQNQIKEIGNFWTLLEEGDNARNENIRLASSKIHRVKIPPKEVFSFNDVVGPCTKENGYLDAPVIVKTQEGSERELGEGGGVCQVSSTLYNACLFAGLEIIEQHSHSKPVGYVSEGRDATIAYGISDFKFRNNRPHPIMIRFEVKDNTLVCILIENQLVGS
jgi:vancomycin resistance protein YoaR